MKRVNLAVLFGGASTEHEVSCRSAASIMESVSKEKYNIFPVGITKEGRWIYCPDISPDRIRSGEWRKSGGRAAFISPERGSGLAVMEDRRLAYIGLDCVFPVLHGANGEDGSVQGLLQLAGIPCVGPLVASSAVCMDKALMRVVAADAGIRQTASEVLRYDEFATAPETNIERLRKSFGYPMFVKPCGSGSSVGVSKAADGESLAYAIEEAAKYDNKVMVEEFIDGREIEVAVLGNQAPVASVPGEILPAEEFYSYDAKYSDMGSKLIIPAELPEEVVTELKSTAVRLFLALDCAGLSRVDFFVRGNEVIFNEINTIPGFTPISMYPKLFEASGISYPDLIDRLVSLAIENFGFCKGE